MFLQKTAIFTKALAEARFIVYNQKYNDAYEHMRRSALLKRECKKMIVRSR